MAVAQHFPEHHCAAAVSYLRDDPMKRKAARRRANQRRRRTLRAMRRRARWMRAGVFRTPHEKVTIHKIPKRKKAAR